MYEGVCILMKEGCIIEVECDVYCVKVKCYEVIVEEVVSIVIGDFELVVLGIVELMGLMKMLEVIVDNVLLSKYFYQEYDGLFISLLKVGGGG